MMIEIYLNSNSNYYDEVTGRSVLSDLQSYLFAHNNHTPLRGRWIIADKAGKKLFQTKFIDHFLDIKKLEGFILQMSKTWLDQMDHIKPELNESGEPTGNDIQISNSEHYQAIMNLENIAGYININPLNFLELKEHFDVESETPNIFAGNKKNELITVDYILEDLRI